jgi:hypothetical protein
MSKESQHPHVFNWPTRENGPTLVTKNMGTIENLGNIDK